MTLDFTQTTPSLSRMLVLAIPAGIVGEMVFEILALAVAPPLLGQAMQPALLVGALAQSLFGVQIAGATGWIVHLLAGAVLFPMGYVVFARALNGLGWPVAAILYAVLLWLLAQGVLAPLAGRPFMLGFGAYTWASLVVHALYVLTVAAVLNRMAYRPGPT
jgi:hypothetical protein